MHPLNDYVSNIIVKKMLVNMDIFSTAHFIRTKYRIMKMDTGKKKKAKDKKIEEVRKEIHSSVNIHPKTKNKGQWREKKGLSFLT